MVKECIRGLIFVLKHLLLVKTILLNFILSSKPISDKNYKLGKRMEVEDI
jgi:hypothetical protein